MVYFIETEDNSATLHGWDHIESAINTEEEDAERLTQIEIAWDEKIQPEQSNIDVPLEPETQINQTTDSLKEDDEAEIPKEDFKSQTENEIECNKFLPSVKLTYQQRKMLLYEQETLASFGGSLSDICVKPKLSGIELEKRALKEKEQEIPITQRKRKLGEHNESFDGSLDSVFKKMSPKSNLKVFYFIEPGAMYAKRSKNAETDSTQLVDLAKAREEKENLKASKASSGFMSDWVIKKSLIERDQEQAKREKEQLAAENIQWIRKNKGIVMAFDLN